MCKFAFGIDEFEVCSLEKVESGISKALLNLPGSDMHKIKIVVVPLLVRGRLVERSSCKAASQRRLHLHGKVFQMLLS